MHPSIYLSGERERERDRGREREVERGREGERERESEREKAVEGARSQPITGTGTVIAFFLNAILNIRAAIPPTR